MKILLDGDDRIRLEDGPEPLTIEADRPGRIYSPYHMLGSALATCTLGVLQSWAEQAGLATARLALEVSWEFADTPHRVARMDVALEWPELPRERIEAAKRVMRICPVHHTLAHTAEVGLSVRA